MAAADSRPPVDLGTVLDWKQEIWEFAKMLAGAVLWSVGWLVAVNGRGIGVVMMAAGLVTIFKG